MKQLSAIAGVLLLSSSLIAGCTPNAAPSPSPDNRAGTYDTSRGGRVIGNTMNGAADEDRLGVVDRIGPDRAGRAGVRNTGDQDRLGVRDNVGPDRAGVRNTGDQDRLGVRDNIGPDRGANLRNDRALEARVEALPGVRDATVLVAGNTAYVALNQGTAANTGRGTTNNTGNTGANINGINDRTGTPGGATLNNALGGRPGGATGRTSTVGNGRPDNRGIGLGTINNDRRGGSVAGTGTTAGNTAGTGTTAGTGGTSAAGNNTSMGTNSAGTTPGAAGTPGITSPGTNYGSAGYAGTGNSTGTAGTYNNDITTPGNRTVGRINNAGTNNAGTAGANNGGVTTRVVPNTIGMGAATGGALSGRQGTMGTVNNGGRATGYNTNNTAGNNTYGNGANIMGNDNNHYVTDDVKAKVTNVIRQGNPGITTVYVSANPGIMNRMGAFTRDANNGRGNNAGNDLLDALRRVWPTGTTAGNAGTAGNNTTNR